jgi:hypothetical protein
MDNKISTVNQFFVYMIEAIQKDLCFTNNILNWLELSQSNRLVNVALQDIHKLFISVGDNYRFSLLVFALKQVVSILHFFAMDKADF